MKQFLAWSNDFRLFLIINNRYENKVFSNCLVKQIQGDVIMNAVKSFLSWIADLFRSLFSRKQDDGEKPTLCGGPVNKDKEEK